MRLALATLAVLAAATEPKPIPLIGIYGMGHACPTTEAIYTAHHIIDNKDKNHVPFSTPYGVATPVWADYTRDLAAVEIDGETPRVAAIGEVPRYRVAATEPTEKEKVHWYEFNFHNRKDFLRQERREAKVLRTVAGHIVFDKGPTGGASGSCLLNEREEVVGIVIWSIPMRGKRGNVGVAASIVNEWNPKEQQQ